MKYIYLSIIATLILKVNLAGQAQGMMTMPPSSPNLEGTSLGANETISYNGIALGNRVRMRGFVDFIFAYQDEEISGESADFSDTAADIDFLLDFSPVTAEIHLSTASGADVSLEQAFGRYSFNQDFSVTFGRQLTALGFDADEAPGLYAVTPAYTIPVSSTGSYLTRNYVDGARLNFNNGQFGLVLGLHDTYGWTGNTNLGEGVAIDIAASAMIVPGLEGRVGFAFEDVEDVDDSISQINTFLSYSGSNLTIALEYDNYNIYGSTLWDIMLMANYSFTDWFAATLRYSHEDNEFAALNYESADRYTLAFLFTVTNNLFFNFEYSHSQREVMGGGDDDLNELYLEALLTF